MNNYTREKLANIANHYGTDSQMRQTQEEAAELIVAISKYERFKTDQCKEALIEEMADVLLMIEQLKILLNINEIDIEHWISLKIYRQESRIKELKS